MEIEKFKHLIERMKSGLLKKLTDLQFEEFLNCFGGEDAHIFERAIQRVINTQRWIPVPAQLKEFIKQIQEEDRASADRQLAEKKQAENTKRKPTGDGGWIRFTRWMFQEHKKWPKERIEVEKMKAKFEKEHPDWQLARKQRQVKRGGMTRIGESLGDAIGNLE